MTKLKLMGVTFFYMTGVGAMLKLAELWSTLLLPRAEAFFGISPVCSFYLFTFLQLIFACTALFLWARSDFLLGFEEDDIVWSLQWFLLSIAIIAEVFTFSEGNLLGLETLSEDGFKALWLALTPVEAYLIPVYLFYGRRTIWIGIIGDASFLLFLPSIFAPCLLYRIALRAKKRRGSLVS